MCEGRFEEAKGTGTRRYKAQARRGEGTRQQQQQQQQDCCKAASQLAGPATRLPCALAAFAPQALPTTAAAATAAAAPTAGRPLPLPPPAAPPRLVWTAVPP